MDPFTAADLATMQSTAAVLRTTPARLTRNTAGTDTWPTVWTGLLRFVPLPRQPGLLDVNGVTPTPPWRIYGPAGWDVQEADRVEVGTPGQADYRRWDVLQPNRRLGAELERGADAEEVL